MTKAPASGDGVRTLGQRFLRVATLALFAVLVTVAVAVFFVLPDLVSDGRLNLVDLNLVDTEATAPASPPPSTVASSRSAPEPAATQPAATGRDESPPAERLAAEEALAELMRKRRELEQQGVEKWAPDEFAAAITMIDTGDARLKKSDYVAAADAYRTAIQALDALAASKTVRLQAALDRGAEALEALDRDAAQSAFSLALAIDPENEIAVRGLARAETLGEFAKHLNRGYELEPQNRFDEARAEFLEAAELDPYSPRAREALVRVDKALAERDFKDTMSQGLTALSQQNLVGARGAFERALTLRPNSTAARDGLAEVQTAAREREIAGHLDRALAFEQQQLWQDAAREFSTVLSMDSGNAEARRGLAENSRRAAFLVRVDRFLDEPERLTSESVRGAVRGLLREAKSIESRGSALSQKLTELRSLLNLANSTVPVTIASDNLTEVAIYRFSELGRFALRNIELRPGTYTVVGSRDGYRDVRKTLTISTGQPSAQIDVRCVEPI